MPFPVNFQAGKFLLWVPVVSAPSGTILHSFLYSYTTKCLKPSTKGQLWTQNSPVACTIGGRLIVRVSRPVSVRRRTRHIYCFRLRKSALIWKWPPQHLLFVSILPSDAQAIMFLLAAPHCLREYNCMASWIARSGGSFLGNLAGPLFLFDSPNHERQRWKHQWRSPSLIHPVALFSLRYFWFFQLSDFGGPQSICRFRHNRSSVFIGIRIRCSSGLWERLPHRPNSTWIFWKYGSIAVEVTRGNFDQGKYGAGGRWKGAANFDAERGWCEGTLVYLVNFGWRSVWRVSYTMICVSMSRRTSDGGRYVKHDQYPISFSALFCFRSILFVHAVLFIETQSTIVL